MANVVIFLNKQIVDILYCRNIQKRATSTGRSVTDPTDIALTERQKFAFSNGNSPKLTQIQRNKQLILISSHKQTYQILYNQHTW